MAARVVRTNDNAPPLMRELGPNAATTTLAGTVTAGDLWYLLNGITPTIYPSSGASTTLAVAGIVEFQDVGTGAVVGTTNSTPGSPAGQDRRGVGVFMGDGFTGGTIANTLLSTMLRSGDQIEVPTKANTTIAAGAVYGITGTTGAQVLDGAVTSGVLLWYVQEVTRINSASATGLAIVVPNVAPFPGA